MIVLILLFISSQTVTELLRVRKWLCDCAFVIREYQFLKEIFCLRKKKKIYISIFPLRTSSFFSFHVRLPKIWHRIFETKIWYICHFHQTNITSLPVLFVSYLTKSILFFVLFLCLYICFFSLVLCSLHSVQYNAFSNVTSSSNIKYINIYIEVIICKGFTGTVLLEKHI